MASIGEGLGRLYVAKYFPPEPKARMEQLVDNLLAPIESKSQTLDWMGPETRQKAQDKLARFTTKIGYPDKWRDYSKLQDPPGRPGRQRAALRTSSSINRNIAKLGKPIDRGEWDMTPQTVNAYYNPEMNEIVFPAAILQPPFFNAKADDAVNYGGIGAVIGHEISHGFDDQGSQYDGNGNLLESAGWLTQADLEHFKARTHALVQQYSALRAGAGLPRQRRADAGREHRRQLRPRHRLQGLSAFAGRQGGAGDRRADRRSALLHGLGAGVARQDARQRGHRADQDRSAFAGAVPRRTAVRSTSQAFYEAFDVKQGDKMYLPPDQRVSIW